MLKDHPGKMYESGVLIDIPKFGDNYCGKLRKYIEHNNKNWAGRVKNFGQCQKKCDNNFNGECDAFMYGDNWCWLFGNADIKIVWTSDGRMIAFKRGASPRCKGTDECKSGTHECDGNAYCTDTAASYTCECKPGYTGDGKTCTDIDECTTGDFECDANAECNNNAGSYDCVCKPVYRGDGKTCTADFCSKDRTWIDGPIKWRGEVAGKWECIKKCREDTTCHAYTYGHVGDEYCWLYSKWQIKFVWPSDGRVSGFKQNPCPRQGAYKN